MKLRYQIPGWGWDKATQLFLASTEQWGRCIEVCFSNIDNAIISKLYVNTYISKMQIYPKAASLCYTPLPNRDLLEEQFEGRVASGKEAIGIHSLTSQMLTIANQDSSSRLDARKKELGENELDSSEIFAADWEESLSDSPQRKNIPESTNGIVPNHEKEKEMSKPLGMYIFVELQLFTII